MTGTLAGAPPAPINPMLMIVRFVAGTVVYAALLFLTAGTIAWPQAWAYLAVIVPIFVAYSVIFGRLHPDLIAERRKPPADAKRWDRPFFILIGAVGPLAFLVAAGLDHRLGWTPPMAIWMNVAGLFLAAGGGALAAAAIAANRFFSAVVRIQRDRGHSVVDTGPYGVVRHPGYTGTMVQSFGAALALGSHAALAVALVTALLTVWRTVLEDRTLRAELDGYSHYARRVRYRLLPGVW
jgi:protein-S-isoprenylcysteine O-methyltransferase Ste14